MVNIIKHDKENNSNNRPITTREKQPAKKEKLGLLTTKKRKDMTFRFRNETVLILDELLHKYRVNVNHKISRTDIIETLIEYADTLECEDFGKILNKFNKSK
mgnify:CR=1 FL=1